MPRIGVCLLGVCLIAVAACLAAAFCSIGVDLGTPLLLQWPGSAAHEGVFVAEWVGRRSSIAFGMGILLPIFLSTLGVYVLIRAGSTINEDGSSV